MTNKEMISIVSDADEVLEKSLLQSKVYWSSGNE
jgi:hypothetical protein